MKKKYTERTDINFYNWKNVIAFLLFLSISGVKSFAQYNTPTVNGTVAAGEYGTHTDGQNQQTNGGQVWYMTWNATNLYIGVTGANLAEGAVAYFDIDVLAPIDGGTTAANGTSIGNAYDGTNFANLPFKADLVVYFKSGYREIRTRTGSNTWSAPITTFGTYSESGTSRELSIPWTSFPGGAVPPTVRFSWFGYLTSAGGSVYGTVPTANAGGSIGTGARYERYFKVDNTTNGAAVKPFNRDCYVFNSTVSNNAFGTINVWDFTMNTAGLQISRGTTGGNWTINGTLLINAGTVFFGSPAVGPFGTSTVANVTVNSGAALDMDQTNQALTVTGNFFTSGIFSMSQQIGGDLNIAGNFTHSTGGNVNATGTRARLINFNGTTAQTISNLPAGTNLSFVTISNTTSTVTHNLGATTIANTLTLNQGAKLALTTAGSLTVNAGANFDINGTTAATTFTATAPATCTVTGTMTRNNAAAVITSTAATLSFSATTGTYNHAVNGSVIPTATWNATSTCNITGVTTTNPTGVTGIFGNFLWNNVGQTSATGAISGAMTVAGNLSVLAGTLLMPTFQITGNASGTVNISNGATLQVGNGATALTFPTLFPFANITLGASSNVIYGCTVAQNVLGGISYGNLTVQGASIKTATAAITVNGNLTVSAGTLADGGFQITGNATGTLSLAAATTLNLGSTVAATTFPSNFLYANISLNITSTVVYNSNVAQTISGLPDYGNLSTSATAAVTKSFGANVTVLGNFVNGVNNTTAFGLFRINLSGTWTNSGTINANSSPTNTGINLVGATPITFTIGTYTGPSVSNFTVAKNAGVAVTLGAILTTFNLNVNSGVLIDNVSQITGNAAGSLNVLNGATLQIGNGATATQFPLNYTTANINLAAGSTVIYGANVAQNISSAPSSYHHLTTQANSVKTALGALTINGNINIVTGTLADGGFQITGNATGTLTVSGGANGFLSLGSASSATVFPTGFVNANIILNSGSTVRYNSNLAQDISNIPNYAILRLTSGAAVTKNLLGNTVANLLTIDLNNTLNLATYTLDLNSAVGGSCITNSGTINSATYGSGTIRLIGSSVLSSFVTGGIGANRFNMVVATTGGVTMSGSTSVAGLTINASTSLALGNQTIQIGTTYTNNGAINGGTGTGRLLFDGTSAQNLTIGTILTNNLNRLEVSNSAGLTIDAPISLTATTGALTLTNGIVTTTSANIITITNVATTAVSGGSSSSYVSGPMRITLQTSLSSGSTYRFPIGKSSFNMFELVNPITNAGLSAVIQAEVFDGNTGGSAGAGFSAINSDNYWSSSVISNSASITTVGQVRITESGLSASNAIGNATTLSGIYNFLGGASISTTITSSVNSPNALGFYVIGTVGNLCGNYTVGTGENFPSITNVFAALNSISVTCDVIFEMTTNYNGTSGESFPLTLNTINYVGGPWTSTVRPALGVTNRITSGDPGGGAVLITFNGASRVTFDGRPGGLGTSRQWTIRNTRTTSVIGGTIIYQNESSNNNLQWCIVEGGAASSSTGMIAISSTTLGPNGNDFISINNNQLRNISGANPANIIYAAGSGIAGRENNDNSILNNEISNFTNYGVFTSATGNGNNWLINNNSFFCTFTGTTGQTAVWLNSPNFGNHQISNNFVGGTAANCGGTAWTNSNGGIAGLILNNGNALSSVNNNTIQNLSLTSISSTNFWISLAQGNTEAIGNIVGHPTTTNSINSNEQTIIGIRVASSGTTNVEDNVIANITSTNTTTTATFFGINCGTAGSFNIDNNQIYNLSSVSTNTANPRIVAIGPGATGSTTQTITRNIIYNLSSSANAAVSLIGIQFTGSSTLSNNNVNRNFIHSFNLTGGNVGASINGIQVNGGSSLIANNVIRLGLNIAGTSVNNTNGCIINGLDQTSTTAGNLFYHNTVFIGGSVASTANTFAFRRSAASGVLTVKNNIFANIRANSSTGRNFAISYNTTTGVNSDYNILWTNSATGSAIGSVNNGTTALNTYQAYRFSLTGQELNSGAGTPNFSAASSDITATPLLASILNVVTPSPAESNGDASVISSVANDYSGAARAGLSPSDIGAFANNISTVDIVPPSIVYTPLINTSSNVNYPLNSVIITDNGSGMPTTGALVPRIWYRRSAPTAGTWASTEGTWNGTTWDFMIDYSLGSNAIVTNVLNTFQYYVVAQDNSGNVWYNDLEAAAPIHTNVNTQSSAPTTPRSYQVFPVFSGSVNVGASETFTSLTRVDGLFASINAGQLSGNLTVNITSNINIEDGTHALNQWTESGVGNYTLTIQNNNTTAKTIEGSYNGTAFNTNGLFRFNGADRVKINGGSGAQRLLTFRNNQTLSTTFSSAVGIYNDANDIKINNCNLQATTGNGSNNGVVYLGGVTTAANDRDSLVLNTISDIGNGTNFPNAAIVAAGITGSFNTGIIIDGNNIANCYTNGGIHYGVRIETFNANITVQNNSIYQTANRNPTLSGAEMYAIYTNTSSGAVAINNNFIGGNSPLAAGNWQISPAPTSPNNYRFVGIWQNAAIAAGNSINNNVINNFVMQSSSGANTNYGIFSAIYIASGNANINLNRIGDPTVDALSAPTLNIASNSTGAGVFGIRNIGTGTLTITNNRVGGFQVSNATGAGVNTGAILHGISTTTGSSTISNNLIGGTSTSTYNFVLTGLNATSAACTLYGISATSGAGYTVTIQNDTIQSTSNGGLTSLGSSFGILCSGGGQYFINNNIISTVRSAGTQNSTGTSAVTCGIGLNTGNTQQCSINGNSINNLIANGSGTTAAIIGITYNGGTSSSNSISANVIHSFNHVSFGSPAQQIGIEIASGSGIGIISNNMIRLGRLADGSAFNSNISFTGILDASTSAQNFWHNTIFIDGIPTGGSSAQNSYAFRRSAASGADFIQNNILANNRTGGFAGSLHFAFATNTTSGFSAASLNSNVYLSASNTEFSLAAAPANFSAAATPALRMQALRAAAPIGNNLRSGIATLAQINFINATGNVAAINLRLNNANCAAGAGVAISGVTTDIDGIITRSTTAPAIGAHESASFNTINATYDVYTPNFAFTAIPSAFPCGGTLTINANVTITDIGTGLNNVPVMWWRRSAPTASAWSSINGTLTSGSNNNGLWNFTATTAGALSETYQYYFVSNDQATSPNIWFSSFDATTPVHPSPTLQTTAATSPSSFVTISLTPLSGTVTVGTAGTYPRFNGTGGLFEAINNSGLSGNLQVNVISDVAELANWTPLNQFTEYCGSGYTVTISPNSATIRTIEANTSAANAMFSFYGVQRLTIDGRFAGSGRYLRLRHNKTTSIFPSTVEFNNGAKNDVLRNCIIEGANTSLSSNVNNSCGVVKIGGPMGFASGTLNNITIQENEIRNLSNVASTLANTPMVLLYLGGASSGATISDITITGNDFYSFQQSAILADNGSSATTNSIGNNLTITNNNIYQTFDIQTYQYPIIIDGLGNTTGHLISGNKIGGSASPSPNITGTWSNSKTDGEFNGIYLNVDNAASQAAATTISNNIISNISLTGTGWGNFIGIRVENGRVNVTGNTIGSLTSSLTTPNIICAGNGDGGFGLTGNTMVAGIWTQSTEEVVIDNNIVCGLSATNGFSFMDAIAHGSNLYFNNILYNTPGGKATITNNQVLFNRSSSRLQNLAIPSPEGFMGIFCWTDATNNLISNNTVRNCGSGTSIWNRNVRIHGMFVGIYGSTTAQTGTVTNNEISHLFNENAGDNTGTINPIIYGLSIANGDWTVSNNTIYLNNGTQGGTVFTDKNTSLRGLNDGMLFNQTNCQARYYNNTVFVSGANITGAGPANSTYAFLRFPLDYGSISITAGAPLELRNNIFINNRSGSGNHRAIGNIANSNSNAAINWSNTTSDYNFLSSTSTTTNVALWGVSTTYTLANWQTLSGGGDANTTHVITTTGSSNATQVNPSELFVNIGTGAANLRIIETPPSDPWPYSHVDGTATLLAAVTTDIDNDLRDLTTPDIGADEFNLCASPNITTQPSSQTVCAGLNTSFTVVNGGLAPFTYQWEENQGSGWNTLANGGVYSNVTTATLSLTGVTAGMNGYLYRVVVTNACGNITSDGLASLTINAAPAITAYSPDGSSTSVNFINNVCNGSNTGFGVTATGAGLTYQWELSTNGGGTWSTTGLSAAPYAGSTTSILSINNTPASFNTYQYRVVVTGTCSPAITSDAGLLNVGAVAINTNPAASTVVCENGNTAITVAATGNNLTYQWQLSTNSGGSWNPISNGGVYSTATTASLTITGATNSMNTYQYRVIVGTTACTPATSTASVLTVNPLLPASVSIAVAPGNTICAGTSVTFTATPTNGGTTPTYQWYLNGTPVGTNSNTYTNAALVNTDQVNVEMTSNAVCPNPALSTSNTITMTVNPILTPSVSIAASPGLVVCQSTLVTISPTPTNGGAAPTYEWFLNGISQGISSTYVTSTLANTNTVYAVMTSNATCVLPATATSNTLTFTVRFPGQWLGYSSDWNTTSNWGCGGLPISTTDVIITGTPEGGSFPQVNSNGTAICRNIELQLGASLDVLTSRDLSIYGNFTNDGTAALGAGTIRFANSATQQILGTVTSQFGTMQVDNSAAGTAVLLQKDAAVAGNVDMTNGSLDLNGFNINLGTTGQVINETSTDRIFGASGEITTTKTLAASTAYNNIAGLGVSITTDAVAPGLTVIDRGHASQQTVVPFATAPNNSILRYFDIEPTINTGLNATLKIDYFDVELSANGSAPIEAQLIPFRSEDAGVTWEGQHFPARLSNSAAANWVQLTQIPAFSRWTLSDWLTEPLPIELLNFTATPKDVEVDLEWVTASEINNDFFTVEKSLDLELWKEVLVKDGAGNSNFSKTYNDVDKNPYSGLSYYRLKQTDFNGTFTHSEPVAVYFSRKSIVSLNGLFTEQDFLHLNYLSNSTTEAVITITDIEGRIVLKTTEAANDGLNQYNYPSAHLAPGMYLVNILQNNQTKVVKVVKL